jgi:hypothetical protein
MRKIIFIICVSVILTSCVKDYDFNPTTTLMRYLLNDSST